MFMMKVKARRRVFAAQQGGPAGVAAPVVEGTGVGDRAAEQRFGERAAESATSARSCNRVDTARSPARFVRVPDYRAGR